MIAQVATSITLASEDTCNIQVDRGTQESVGWSLIDTKDFPNFKK